MLLQIVRKIDARVCTFSAERGEESTQRVFRPGELFQVGEHSPIFDSTVVELYGLGYVELPNDCWKEVSGVALRFIYDDAYSVN